MFDELTDEALECELCSQAAHLSAGESHLLEMIAEIDRREIWAAQGATSCAHWLSWRIGTALGAAREQLRVAHRLQQLPATRTAFAAGELSYSKVRAITRIADASTDEELVELARHASAAQLEQIVRDYRRAGPDEQERAKRLHRLRYLRHHTDEEGMVVLRARLEPAEAAIVLAALEVARQALSGKDSEEEEEEEEEEDSATDDVHATAEPGAESGAVGPEVGTAATGVSAETSWVADQDGLGSDVSAETSRDARDTIIDAPATNAPATNAPTTGVPTTGVPTTGVPTTEAARTSEATGSSEAAGAVVEHDDPWSPAAGADELETDEPLDHLETSNADALVALCQTILSRGIQEGLDDPKVWLVVHVDEQVLAEPCAPGCCHLERLGSITGHAAARLACEGAVTRLVYRRDGTVEQEGATRTIPDSMRRALLARDRGCRFPGCNAKHFLHAHHVVYVSHGGRTMLSNLVTLCTRHHHLVHDGGWVLQLERGGALRVFRPDGTLLPNVPRFASGSSSALAARNASRGVEPHPEALGSDGDRCDFQLAVDGLRGLAQRAARAGSDSPLAAHVAARGATSPAKDQETTAGNAA